MDLFISGALFRLILHTILKFNNATPFLEIPGSFQNKPLALIIQPYIAEFCHCINRLCLRHFF